MGGPKTAPALDPAPRSARIEFGSRQWAWQTAIEASDGSDSAITDLLAYQAALLPDN